MDMDDSTGSGIERKLRRELDAEIAKLSRLKQELAISEGIVAKLRSCLSPTRTGRRRASADTRKQAVVEILRSGPMPSKELEAKAQEAIGLSRSRLYACLRDNPETFRTAGRGIWELVEEARATNGKH